MYDMTNEGEQIENHFTDLGSSIEERWKNVDGICVAANQEMKPALATP